KGASPPMATKSEQIRELCDFFAASFKAPELAMFLAMNEYAEVASAVDQGVGSVEYFFNVVTALDRRGLIKDVFFARLRQERPNKDAVIRGLQESWLGEGERKRYDAFLSYNSQDRPAVEELGRRLRAEGLRLSREVDELTPGSGVQPGLAEALRNSK